MRARAACAVVIGSLALAGARMSSAQAPKPQSIFRFTTDEFWLNLHHFLYVLGRAEARMNDASREAVADAPADANRGLAGLTVDEHHAWAEPATFYARGRGGRSL